jgi:hypothetical protein
MDMSDHGGNRWLRHHFHEFVFPAYLAAEKKSTEIGSPVDVKASPSAPEGLPTELRKLWTLCQDFKEPWELDVREINYSNGNSRYRETAKIHYKVLHDTVVSAKAALRDEGSPGLLPSSRPRSVSRSYSCPNYLGRTLSNVQ